MVGDHLSVERLTAPTDRLRCGPLRAVLTVRGCVQQHASHTEGPCASCPIGADLARRFPAERGERCVCGARVTGAKGRLPRCPRCRKGGDRG